MRLDDVPRMDDLTRDELGLAVQENLFGLFGHAVAAGAELGEETDRRAAMRSFRNPMFKGIWNVRDVSALDDAVAWHADRGAPFTFPLGRAWHGAGRPRGPRRGARPRPVGG